MNKTRKIIIAVLSVYLLAYSPTRLIAAVKVAPYYALNILQGASIPSKGEWMWTLNMTNDLGILAKINDKQSVVGFYELKYTGPGFRKQEGEKFSDRMMDHILVFRHHYKFLENYTLKSQIDYMNEFKRTGTNEVWGKGLYDFERSGLAFFVERKFNPELTGDVSIQYHQMIFPNYTDLLAEYQAAGSDAESSAGKQNHVVIQLGSSVKCGANKGAIDITMMNYSKQKVVVDAVQPDGTYYSGTLQKDMLIAVSAQREQKLWQKLLLTPSITLKLKDSNQNYQHFTNAVSNVPVLYLADYYDYTEFDIPIPIAFLFATKWEYFVNLEWDFRNYNSRPPRQADNTFADGKQANTLFIWGSGFTFKPNPVTRTTVFYQYQSQSSSCKFEKYLPYNYDGHFVGINFGYTY